MAVLGLFSSCFLILSKRLGKYKTQALLNDSANRHTGVAVCVYKCALRVCRLWSFYGGA